MEDGRSPEEIRRSVAENRVAFEKALRQLKQQVNLLTDWRYQYEQHRKRVLIGAVVAGAAVAAGLSALARSLKGHCS